MTQLSQMPLSQMPLLPFLRPGSALAGGSSSR